MKNRKYSKEMYEFLQRNARTYTAKQMVKILKDRFNVDMTTKQYSQYCYHMGIKYKYENPNKSHGNKGLEIGTIANKTDGNMLKIKVGEHKWEYLQRKIYEDYYGVKLPPDVYVVFLDQNRRNFDIKNLKAISRRSCAIMSKGGLFSTSPKLTKLGHLSSKVIIKTNDIREEVYYE